MSREGDINPTHRRVGFSQPITSRKRHEEMAPLKDIAIMPPHPGLTPPDITHLESRNVADVVMRYVKAGNVIV